MNSVRSVCSIRSSTSFCTDSSLSLETYGKIVQGDDTDGRRICTWALQVKNGKFVVLEPKDSDTTYWTGELIEESIDPQYLVTTTSAAPN